MVDLILEQIKDVKISSFEDYLRKIDKNVKIQLLKEYGPSWISYLQILVKMHIILTKIILFITCHFWKLLINLKVRKMKLFL